MVETDSIDDVLALLSGETPEALRGERLPLLFQVATACAWENAPQVALLVEKAFSGEAGLAALREQQRRHLNDCLLAFDDSVLFLHSQLLEDERLGRRVSALRRRKQVVPAGRFRYDEGVE